LIQPFILPDRPNTLRLSTSAIALGGLTMTHTILRLPTVKAESGLSRSTIYLRIAQGLWTKPVSLGARAVGWPASEVATLNAARISGKSNSEIRDLVAKLDAARKIAG
jgi:prophage regulatory protein